MAECCYAEITSDACPFSRVGLTGEFVVGTKSYCLFHAPAEIKQNWSPNLTKLFINKFNSISSEGNISDFSGIIFPPDISVGTVSGGLMDFRKSHFCQNVTLHFNSASSFFFDDATFESNFTIGTDSIRSISFRNARFAGDADFSKIKEVGTFDCESAEFVGQANFFGIEFHSRVSFADAKFHKAPMFLNCQFPQSSSFHEMQIAGLGYTEIAESSYRHVRKQMSENKSRDYEGRFYVYEQRCARKRYGFGIGSVVSWLYDVFSEYGTSFELALLWLIEIQIAAFVIYYLLSVVLVGAQASVNSLISFTLAQLFRPFEIFSFKRDEVTVVSLFGKQVSSYIQYISAAQAILSLSLLALFFLALRWRFKRE